MAMPLFYLLSLFRRVANFHFPLSLPVLLYNMVIHRSLKVVSEKVCKLLFAS